jgi:hypothetical protein
MTNETEGRKEIEKEDGIEEKKYLISLSDKEYKSYLIAKSHLGSSFRLSKSIGFIAWQKLNKL